MTIDQLDELLNAGQRRANVTVAATALALRRHRERQDQAPRIWTGYIEGRKRAYRGQRVVLPDHTIGFVYGIQRGKAAIWRVSPFIVGEEDYMVLDVADIKVYKMPSAQVLGRRKAGVLERRSARKQASSRRNGSQPCAPGRRRGRPRNVDQPATPQSTPTCSRPRAVGNWLPKMSFQEAVDFFSAPPQS